MIDSFLKSYQGGDSGNDLASESQIAFAEFSYHKYLHDEDVKEGIDDNDVSSWINDPASVR